MNPIYFEKIYDKYAVLLYNIALEICPSTIYAERVFIKTFINIYEQNTARQISPSYYIQLIQLVLTTAKNELYPINEHVVFKLNQFENTPLLQQLICNAENLDNYCIKNNISKQNGLHILRQEFIFLKNKFV